MIPLLVGGFGLRRRAGVVAVAAITAAAMVETFVAAGIPIVELPLQIGLLLPQLLLFGAAAMGLRYLLDVQAQLRAARSQAARLAVEEERARISRDLHDLLGHSLSVITMKGELASRQIPEGEPGGAEVREMVRLARDALSEVRATVSGYRKPTIATELTAARTALRAAGIRLDVEQTVGALSPESEAVLGWTIREGVTNVIRHSGASHCSIVLSGQDSIVRAEVLDDGRGVSESAGGTGLQGLTDRVAAVGGHLEAGGLPHRGFRLRVTAPRPGP
jgi:two-component system sensor histidine kinase DesK